MKGPKYIESNIMQIVFRDQDYQLHQQKLNQVSSENSMLKKLNQIAIKQNQQIRNNMSNTRIANQSLKDRLIQKDNEKILTRIMEINNRDVRPSKSQASLSINSRVNSASSHKSLNFTSRKKDAYKIAAQNAQFMGRLLSTQSTLRTKKSLNKEYQNRYCELKNRISRLSEQSKTRLTSYVSFSMTRELSFTQAKINRQPKFSTTKEFKPKFPKNKVITKDKSQQVAAHLVRIRINPSVQQLKLPKIK